LRPEQSNIFFKLMEERYGKKATIITTNLEYEDWYGFLGQKEMVAALLDRLRHRCHTVRVEGAITALASDLHAARSEHAAALAHNPGLARRIAFRRCAPEMLDITTTSRALLESATGSLLPSAEALWRLRP
jgi:hypothetical protein